MLKFSQSFQYRKAFNRILFQSLTLKSLVQSDRPTNMSVGSEYAKHSDALFMTLLHIKKGRVRHVTVEH
jgi:hypothetical protein